MNRQTTVVASVIALHIGALWALQSGLLHRVAEAVMPAEILVEIMAPAAPLTPPAPQPVAQAQPKVQPKPPTPKPPAPQTPTPAVQPTPSPLAIAPSANAPEPSEAAPTAAAAAPASTNTGNTANAPPAPPAPPKIILPSSDVYYLNNPKPRYPPLSMRISEQGTVLVSVFIGIDGNVQKMDLKKSSGFDRLDLAAMDAVRRWRFAPGSHNGVPEAMWVTVPIPFQLTN